MPSATTLRSGAGWLPRVLLAAAGILGVLALIAWMVSGFQFSAGPVRVSATEPSRLWLEAAVVWLLSAIASQPFGRTRILLPLAVVVGAAVVNSAPRRVGDGAEYMAMALSMSRGDAPAVSPRERAELTRELRALPGFSDADLNEPLIGRDGRQDFYHFWLYPALAAPLTLVARLTGLHINHAFTIVNLALLGLFAVWLTRGGHSTVAVLLLAGPLLWWVDKAHAEILLFVSLAFAVLLLEERPAWALVAAGVAAAQNPAALLLLVGCGLAALTRDRGSRPAVAAFLCAGALAAVPMVYYAWRLGTWSPLTSTVGWDLPGVRAVLTPLLDLNLGVIPYAPVLVLLAALGFTRLPRTTQVVSGGAAAGLLVMVAQAGNVNHGGTPGPSRYAIWLLALMTPAIVEGVTRARARRPAALAAATMLSVIMSIWLFKPTLADRSTFPNGLAAAIWTAWPSIDNPLPEVFAERLSGIDGRALVPIATGRCEKVLIRGDGTEAWWPVPCVPTSRAPAVCTGPGALCYVNAGVYRQAPAQAHFIFDPTLAHAWTRRHASRFASVLGTLGANPRTVRPPGRGSRIGAGNDLDSLYIVEGRSGLAAWVQTTREPAAAKVLHLNLSVRSRLEMLDGESLEPLAEPSLLEPGPQSVPVPPSRRLLVVVADAT